MGSVRTLDLIGPPDASPWVTNFGEEAVAVNAEVPVCHASQRVAYPAFRGRWLARLASARTVLENRRNRVGEAPVWLEAIVVPLMEDGRIGHLI
jgi:hypothetical protein